MKIAMIAAMADNRVIGADNSMPWHLPADLRHFKQTTLGKPVVMGRKTYESIGKALPGRLNIVVTSQRDYFLPDATVVDSLETAVAVAEAMANGAEEVMIIGGGKIYEAMLEKADTLYLTLIDAQVDGDTYFPDYETNGNWHEVSREAHEADEKNEYGYSFLTLQRAD